MHDKRLEANNDGTRPFSSERSPQRDAGTPSLVTVLFADVVASAAQIAGFDAEEARDLLDDALARMRLRIHEFGGTLARVQGDGVMAIFGAPVSTEDHALRACCAAHAICRDFDGADASPISARVPAVRFVRVGVHSGKVLTRMQRNDYGVDFDAVGPDVHLAAKIESRSKANAATISKETLQLAGAAVEAEDCGELIIGDDRRLALFQLKSIALHYSVDRLFAQRPSVPFVGRQNLLARLTDQARAIEGGTGMAVSIIADAGMGKSRLLYELNQGVSTHGIRTLEIRGISLQKRTPFAPLRPFEPRGIS